MPGGNLTIIGLCVAGGLLVILGVAGMVRKARRALKNSLLGQIYSVGRRVVSEGQVCSEDFMLTQ